MHLGLAAGECRGSQAPPLGQAGKGGVGALQHARHAARVPPEDPGTELEILVHGELGRDVRALRDVSDAQPLDGVGRRGLDLRPVPISWDTMRKVGDQPSELLGEPPRLQEPGPTGSRRFTHPGRGFSHTGTRGPGQDPVAPDLPGSRTRAGALV
jgi:hypothetical protein